MNAIIGIEANLAVLAADALDVPDLLIPRPGEKLHSSVDAVVGSDNEAHHCSAVTASATGLDCGACRSAKLRDIVTFHASRSAIVSVVIPIVGVITIFPITEGGAPYSAMTRANMVVTANVASFSCARSPAECTPIIDSAFAILSWAAAKMITHAE